MKTKAPTAVGILAVAAWAGACGGGQATNDGSSTSSTSSEASLPSSASGASGASAMSSGAAHSSNSTTDSGESSGRDGGSATGDASAEDASAGDGAPSSSDASTDAGARPADASADADGSTGIDASMGADSGAAPAVRRIGRFDLSDPSQPAAEWSGSAMEADFTGTSVSVALGGDNNYFAIVVDGTLQPVLETTGASTYSIATGLAAGTHHVLVFRRDEAFDEPAQFVGFTFGGGGALLAPPATPPHKIELVGDSISAGYGVECTNASQAFSAATENEYTAYGSIAARDLDADIHVIAWSGKGIYRNYDGTMTETMPTLWERTLPTDATSTWDPSQWIPDAVVINLGTNDYAPSGDPSAEFQATYLQFVAQLRSVYANAYFFLALGPMLSDPSLSEARTALENVIAMRATAGDTKMQLVEFPTQSCGSDGSGCGCDSHPNAATHESMATMLESAIQTTLGW